MYQKILSIIYFQKTASWIKEDVLYNICNVSTVLYQPFYANVEQQIRTQLTLTYSLDTSKKEKARLFIKDLAMLLNYYQVYNKEVFAYKCLYIQLAANLILTSVTATQLGVLIGQLLYKYLEFQLFPLLLEEQQLCVVLRVNLENIKQLGSELE